MSEMIDQKPNQQMPNGNASKNAGMPGNQKQPFLKARIRALQKQFRLLVKILLPLPHLPTALRQNHRLLLQPWKRRWFVPLLPPGQRRLFRTRKFKVLLEKQAGPSGASLREALINS